MPLVETASITAILGITVASHLSAVLCLVQSKYREVFFFLAMFSGFLNLLVWRKRIKREMKMKKIYILLKEDKVIYIAEMYNCFVKTYNFKINWKINLAILLYGVLDMIRVYLSQWLQVIFFYADEFKYYKDVIKLERYILKSKYGHKDLSDQFIIDYIQTHRSKYDPRVIFCLWSDDQETNKLVCHEEALAVIKNKIQEKEDAFTFDHIGDANIQDTIQLKEEFFDEQELEKAANYTESETAEMSTQKDNFQQGEYSETSPLKKKNKGDDEVLELSFLSQHELDKLKILDEEHKIIEKDKNVHVISKERIKQIEKGNLAGKINRKSLNRFFNEDEAADCLRILTQNFDDHLTFENFYENMRQLNNERSNFLHLIQANSGIQSRINLATIGFEAYVMSVFFFKLFATKETFNASVLPVLIFMLPVFYHLFTPFLFLVYHRPYMINDRVIIDNETFLVKEIFITYTLLDKWNNDCCIIPNAHINGKSIRNIRRSNSQKVEIKFYFDCLENGDLKLRELRKRMERFVAASKCFEQIQILVNQIKISNFYELHAIIKHNINHQNSFFTWIVQNRFMQELVRQCSDLQIMYTPMPMQYLQIY